MSTRDQSGPGEPGPPPDPLKPSDNLYKDLFPKDEWPVCKLCDMPVPDIRDHLPQMHPKTSFEAYVKSYPNERYYDRSGRGTKPAPKRLTVKVSEKEAAEHPGGRDAAFIEKTLEGDEAQLYRSYVIDLLKEKLPAGFELANIALDKILASRLIILLSEVRNGSDGRVIGTEHQQNLAKIRTKIDDGLKSLRESAAAATKDIDPLKMWERDQAEAEAYVRAHIGEHTARCPNPACGQILTAPELPHWAFAPMMTSHGVEWPVWSPELWDLVKEGTLPLWVMAFVLRTSPEGLRYTARRRGEVWPHEFDADLPAQEGQLRARLNEADANFQPEHLQELVRTEFQDVKGEDG